MDDGGRGNREGRQVVTTMMQRPQGQRQVVSALVQRCCKGAVHRCPTRSARHNCAKGADRGHLHLDTRVVGWTGVPYTAPPARGGAGAGVTTNSTPPARRHHVRSGTHQVDGAVLPMRDLHRGQSGQHVRQLPALAGARSPPPPSTMAVQPRRTWRATRAVRAQPTRPTVRKTARGS